MSEQFTVRLFRQEDMPGLLRLWEENTDWGTLTPEIWRQWYVDTPYGPCIVGVALDEADEVAAQLVFTPSRVVIGDRTVRALRISAPILRRDLRASTTPLLRNPEAGDLQSRLEHPIARLFFTALDEAAKAGYQLAYTLPQYRWLSLLQRAANAGLAPFSSVEWPCVAVPVAPVQLADADPAHSLTAQEITEFSQEYADLWQSARQSYPIACGVVREPKWLQWRNGGNRIIEVRDSQAAALVGFAAVSPTGLLFDALTSRPELLAPTLAATLNHLAQNPSKEMTMLKAMQTPALQPALRSLGFVPIDYQFAFARYDLDPVLSVDVNPLDRWYVMPGD